MHHEIGIVDSDGVAWRERFPEVYDAQRRWDRDIVCGSAEKGDFDVGGRFRW